jgi:hypothetical protein
MEMLAAPIGLFAVSQIGRCPVGRPYQQFLELERRLDA